jgi:hypothetical protein
VFQKFLLPPWQVPHSQTARFQQQAQVAEAKQKLADKELKLYQKKIHIRKAAELFKL